MLEWLKAKYRSTIDATSDIASKVYNSFSLYGFAEGLWQSINPKYLVELYQKSNKPKKVMKTSLWSNAMLYMAPALLQKCVIEPIANYVVYGTQEPDESDDASVVMAGGLVALNALAALYLTRRFVASLVNNATFNGGIAKAVSDEYPVDETVHGGKGNTVDVVKANAASVPDYLSNLLAVSVVNSLVDVAVQSVPLGPYASTAFSFATKSLLYGTVATEAKFAHLDAEERWDQLASNAPYAAGVGAAMLAETRLSQEAIKALLTFVRVGNPNGVYHFFVADALFALWYQHNVAMNQLRQEPLPGKDLGFDFFWASRKFTQHGIENLGRYLFYRLTANKREEGVKLIDQVIAEIRQACEGEFYQGRQFDVLRVQLLRYINPLIEARACIAKHLIDQPLLDPGEDPLCKEGVDRLVSIRDKLVQQMVAYEGEKQAAVHTLLKRQIKAIDATIGWMTTTAKLQSVLDTLKWLWDDFTPVQAVKIALLAEDLKGIEFAFREPTTPEERVQFEAFVSNSTAKLFFDLYAKDISEGTKTLLDLRGSALARSWLFMTNWAPGFTESVTESVVGLTPQQQVIAKALLNDRLEGVIKKINTFFEKAHQDTLVVELPATDVAAAPEGPAFRRTVRRTHRRSRPSGAGHFARRADEAAGMGLQPAARPPMPQHRKAVPQQESPPRPGQ